ncbi:MAG: polar amino acid transport system substrate-binding protein [Actinomycetota bacterium]|nr:polar amino acid transport system substrate-binding protein [Actinomycetota bacterium]
MKRMSLIVAACLLVLAACAEEPKPNAAAGGGSGDTCAEGNLPLYEDGVLTVATDRPAYEPWFKGSPKDYSGFEGDFAAGVADRLGVPIKWVVEPFNKSYAPGSKDYDFDVNQVTITPERSQAVDFSDPYFENNQGFLVMEDSPAASAATVEDIKGLQLGAQVGTTALAFINTVLQPDKDPKVFDTTNDAKSALEAGTIDVFVTDLVTTVYLRDFEIKGSKVLGQYPKPENFGALFEKGNPLVECVNSAIQEMKDDGTLQDLQDEWLKQYLKIPTFQ